MALPTLTPEQRADALAKAAAARTARTKLREQLKAGELTFQSLLDKSADDAIVAKTKVSYALESLPGVGKVKAAELMTTIGITPTRRIGGLGTAQRTQLLAALA
ncbi:hypothetical protein GCM10007304_37410 [Rhodococcoides trifolii]|jgi:hypothetical protein|uniref:Integration host factor-like helix-two turn-helix domain-containing protein n=1 Tax=Rhodococcoides trifolii TaxID=908250 RepID=A0A917G339_9NOCA|nr:integration host factor, actinobacterial type [Rhodococcus trifolii]GGG20033.1 hypothetical protein GCM10007304_37410 [Rhodococcus trifolii]